MKRFWKREAKKGNKFASFHFYPFTMLFLLWAVGGTIIEPGFVEEKRALIVLIIEPGFVIENMALYKE